MVSYQNEPNMDKRIANAIDRRRFLKYAGATAAIVGATALGAEYLLQPSNENNSQPTQTTTTSSKINHPPEIESLDKRPKYLNPTDKTDIRLGYIASDPDGDPLTAILLIDNKPLIGSDGNPIHNNPYVFKLPQGDHTYEVDVSDGQLTSKSAKGIVTVEPNQIPDPNDPTKLLYQPQRLDVKYKGVRYIAGPITPEWDLPNPSEDEMDEQLETIYKELGCNAISIVGGSQSEDKMIKCAQLAIDKGFERITIQPSYVNATVDETIERIGKFGAKVRSLREKSDRVVYMFGHEFGLETAIVEGNNWFERFANLNKGQGWDKIQQTLPKMFKDIIAICAENYGYELSYAAIPVVEVDLVPWANPIFESIGVDAYIQDPSGWDEKWVIALLSRLKKFGKPVHSTDWGMASFEGADQFGGLSVEHLNENRPYDEEPQRRYIERYFKMLNQAKIAGCFWVQYNDRVFEKGYALYNPRTRNRKEGFREITRNQIGNSND